MFHSLLETGPMTMRQTGSVSGSGSDGGRGLRTTVTVADSISPTASRSARVLAMSSDMAFPFQGSVFRSGTVPALGGARRSGLLRRILGGGGALALANTEDSSALDGGMVGEVVL